MKELPENIKNDILDCKDVDIELICATFKFTENFIRENCNKLPWDYISYYQELSEDFIIEFQSYIYFPWLIQNYMFKTYSNEMHAFILKKLVKDISYNKDYFYKHLTKDMKEQYERLSIML